jgi:hypothetical protein
MTFLSGLALVLLTMVGYTSGAAAVAGKRQPVPFLIDLPVLGVLWATAFLLLSGLGHWQRIGIAFAAAFAVSVFVTLLRRSSLPPAPKASPGSRPKTPDSRRSLLDGWKAFSHRMGNYQGRLILAFFYFIVALPFGLLVRLFSDPLALRKPAAWHEKPKGPEDVDQARLQF